MDGAVTSEARNESARSAGGPGEGRAGPRLRRRRTLVVLLRVALVVLVVVGVLELQAAASYRVSTGSVSFQLRPAWPGGQLVMPLGPAGELSLHTHRTPVDVVMDYRLPAQTAALIGAELVAAGAPDRGRRARSVPPLPDRPHPVAGCSWAPPPGSWWPA